MVYSKSRQKRIGRATLLIIYLLYCLIYVACLARIPLESRNPFLGSSIVTMLWTTVLFTALALGKNWARFILLGLLLLTILFSLPMFLDAHLSGSPLPPIMWLLLAFHVIVFLTLIYSSPIRALVRK